MSSRGPSGVGGGEQGGLHAPWGHCPHRVLRSIPVPGQRCPSQELPVPGASGPPGGAVRLREPPRKAECSEKGGEVWPEGSGDGFGSCRRRQRVVFSSTVGRGWLEG